MNIPLNEFEQAIDPVILKRGLAYYQDDLVTDFLEIATGEYEVNVLGTLEYTVRLEIENNTIIGYECDCPYDMGPICKHVVASLFYLKQVELNLSQQNFTLPNFTLPKKKKRKSVEQQLNEVLSKVSHEELKEFIQEQSKMDKQFRNLFLSNFAHLNESQSKEFYQRQVKSIVNSATNRHGFIGWHEIPYLEQGINSIITIAEKQLKNGNHLQAFYVCTALVEEMTETLQFCDDSNGAVGGIINNAYDMLRTIAKQDISEEVRKTIFEYCIAAFKDHLLKGWDWDLETLHIAHKLISNEKDADIVLECLGTVNDTYERNSAQFLKLEIITAYKGEEEAQKYIDKHITNPTIRTHEIAKATENKAFERAIKLSKEGIEFDQKDKPGLVKNWYNWLLKIAQQQNDKAKIIVYARYLLIDSFMPEEDYYEILKQHVDPEKWNEFLEEIIAEIGPEDNWRGDGLIRRIFIREKWWDRLFSMLKKNVSLQNIEDNEQYLSKDYAPELIQLYSERLPKYVDRNIGRKYYKNACKYLRRMKKLGGHEEVEKLVTHFRTTYPRRNALLDELSRV